MKRIGMLLIISILSLSLSACDLSTDLLSGNDQSAKNWALVEESADSSTVAMAVDLSDNSVKTWLQEDLVNHIQNTYNIELQLIEVDTETIKEVISTELATETSEGRYDLVLVDPDGYLDFLKSDLLYGPFLENLPNSADFINTDLPEFKYYQGLDVNGYLSPIGRSQLSMIYNQDIFYEAPEDYEDMLDFLKEYKNSFVYPDPRLSFEGEMFVVGIAARNVNLEKLMNASTTEAVAELVGDNLEILNEFEPYMYEKGTYYPETIQEIDALFAEEEVIFSMSMNYDHATEKAQSYEFPEGAASFVFKSGTTGLVKWIGIAATATNKSGAMVVINELLSPDIQASRYDVDHGGDLPVYEPGFTPDEAFDPLKSHRLRSTSLKYDDLLSARIGTIPLEVRKIILKMWEEQVLNSPSEE